MIPYLLSVLYLPKYPCRAFCVVHSVIFCESFAGRDWID